MLAERLETTSEYPQNRMALLRPVLAFCIPFILYCFTLAPSIYALDSAELTTAAATLGITRSTGYPLYILLGHLWSKLPVGDVGYRMNLFSAFFGALTILLTDRLLVRWRVGALAALGGLGLLATAPYFWGMAIIAEVYTLQTALVSAILFALQKWDEAPTMRHLVFLAALVGLSLTHHGSSILLLPGLLFSLFTHHRQKLLAPRILIPSLAAGLIALGLYAYLPIRQATQPLINYAGIYDAEGVFQPVALNTWQGFWWLVSGQGFRGIMFAYAPADIWAQVSGFGKELLRAFFAVGIGPGLLGFVCLFRKNRRMASVLAAWFLLTAVFYINYRAADKVTMFLPCYFAWAIFVSVGYHELIRWLQNEAPEVRKVSLLVLRSAMILTVAAALLWNAPLVDQSDEWLVRFHAEKQLAMLPQNAVVIGYWDSIPVMEYLQHVEGLRQDVTLINRFLIPASVFPSLLSNLSQQKPLYLTYYPSQLPAGLKTTKLDDMYRVVNEDLLEEVSEIFIKGERNGEVP